MDVLRLDHKYGFFHYYKKWMATEQTHHEAIEYAHRWPRNKMQLRVFEH